MKMRIPRFGFSALILIYITGVYSLLGQVTLPHLYSDGMLLQRDQPIPIWGWAAAGEEVNIDFAGRQWTAISGEEGKWQISIPAQAAGGPLSMVIHGEGQTIHMSDIWIGDLWVCSGQSNMELTMARVAPMFPEEFERDPVPQIRYFDVPDAYDFGEEQEDTQGGKWVEAGPDYLKDFSAVAYFFAKQLYQQYGIPIGLVNASVGGSPIQSWLRSEELKAFPKDYQEAMRFKDSTLIEAIQREEGQKRQAWHEELNHKDSGLASPEAAFYTPQTSTEGWQEMDSVDLFRPSQGKAPNGVYWVRKDLNLTSVGDEDAKLLLGRLIDSDEAYVNGHLVGSTSYQYPPRRYEVPAAVLKKGKNSIVLRIVSEQGIPGFVKGKPYELIVGDEVYDLSTGWSYLQTAEMPPIPGQTFIRWKPLGLYQAMISPLQQLPIKGLIWYQGESNAGQPSSYARQMEALISGWRAAWGQPDLPFIYAQLPNFMQAVDQPSQSGWAELREAQREVLQVPATGMAVTIDAGEANDIHPLDKETVGTRLAMQAMRVAYGEKGDLGSPGIASAILHQGQIILGFEDCSGLQTRKAEAVGGFALAGENGVYYWAEGRIEGQQIILTSPISSPKMVRYAWANNPEKANVYGANGLPLGPFEIQITQE
ncbi:9-O-acetylesterase [Echinicola pacifica]|uniref:9-O-acetylesterase n=1 Tax=Echinicola pacifica TaxID=346377 RepID=A0A918QAT3_9BACT|nr:sialate O-acetylesterase [Echinicola pacifica]GGZ37419.1 9-O-acetylesterase [Echinicola pacifica]